MAPVPATITVNFTSNYAGPHRVCWRMGNSGPYNCSTVVSCLGGGNACSAIIPVMVDNSTCDPVDFNGYAQAACELDTSLNGRVAFSTVFTPVPPCSKWNVTCNSVGIPSYTLLTPGSSYTVGSNPALTIIGGGGTGAAAHGVVGNGGIKTWTITNGGTGYQGGGSATVLNVPALNITGTGTGAIFDVTIVAGIITAIAISSGDTDPGTGYAVSDTFEFDNTDLGGTGSGAIITINSINTGEIQYIITDVIGSGYSSSPTVTFPSSPGDSATGEAVLGQCPTFDFGSDCDGNALGMIDPQDLGFIYKKCSAVAPTPSTGWIVAQSGCCYDCVTAVFTALGEDGDISYTDCTTGELIRVTVPVVTPLEVCVVNNSWFWAPEFNFSVGTSPGCEP